MRTLLRLTLAFSILTIAGCSAVTKTMDGASMTMSDMSSMLKDKTGDAFDKAFLQMMIPHHEGAVDMANLALKYAKHEEVKKMARDILATQQKEIDQMKAWQNAWGYGQSETHEMH